jgi:hypothetical protein
MSFNVNVPTNAFERSEEDTLPNIPLLKSVLFAFIPADAQVVMYLPEYALLDYAYTRLSEEGYDADAVLLEAGVISEGIDYEIQS